MSRRLSPKPLSKATLGRAAARHHPIGPPPRDNTRALRTGAQANGRNLPGFPDMLARVTAVISEGAPWIQSTDQFAVENLAASLTTFRYAESMFASMTPAALMRMTRAQEVNNQRLRAINELARDLGLTPAGRIKLGLQAAKTQAIVKPVKSADRAAEVARILVAAGALPPIEAQPVVEPEPVAEVKVVHLHPADEQSA